jgi:hypothetical protein
VTVAVLDDHLLRDLLSNRVPAALRRLLRARETATTNLFYVRLSRSVASARGGRLTGNWTDERRAVLGRALTTLPDSVQIVPLRDLAFRVGFLAEAHHLSTLGAEALAATEMLGGALCVWAGDDGPRIRAAARQLGVDYRTIDR